MKNKNELCRNGDEIDIEDICPFMSKFDTGAGNFTGFVKCVEGKCKCWNKIKKKCGVKR